MTVLAPADHRRLKSTLTLLGSDKDGEVLAAVAAAKRILAKVALGFADLDVTQQLPPPRPAPEPSPWSSSQAGPRSSLLQHQRTAALLLSAGHPWDEWKRQFLISIRSRVKPLTSGQNDKLAECVAMAAAWRAARGFPDVDF